MTIVILDPSKGKKHMDIAVRKRFNLAPLVALLIGLSAVFCMVFAETSSAAVPAGVGCQPTDGKINGRGSTYQTVLLKEYAKAFGEDFCGNVAEQYSGDPAGSAMVVYNYAKAAEASATGSGNGVKAANCRTDAFAGTDIPYSQAQLVELDGTPGAAGIGGCGITFEPPFTPNSALFPNANDIQANVMALPVGGSAVTVAVHLGTTSCTGAAPTSLQFTPKEVSRLYGGDVATWNDAELVATNPSLKECTGPVTRVVREDSSGTTNILKQYLIRVDNERTGATCKGEGNPATPITWEAGYFTNNVLWPGKQHEGAEGTCSKITTGALSGGAELIAKLKTVEGGIGYIDLAEAVGQAGIVLASVQNATGTKEEAPSIGGGAANCLYSALSLPGSSKNDAVGLNTEDNWSNNNELSGNPNHENATDLGSKYPICGLTFDLVYTGLHSNNGEGKGAISRLTPDQRRTLYAFFTFILSSTGQEVPGKIHYAPLPASWLPLLEQGFQANF